MEYSIVDYRESAEYISSRLGDFKPEILVVLGTGLGFLAEDIEEKICIPYAEIPHFRISTAPSHAGRFVCGRFFGKNVAFMQGRLHCYEGYSMQEVTFPIRTMRLVGTDKLIITNAAGCVNADWRAGDIMLITDHIRLFGFSPLNGPNIEEFGPRFNDMSDAYTREYRELALKEAARLHITLRSGVYMYFPGPSYETPAEVRAARVLGADAVGMSTVPEVTVAAHAGMKILGYSLLTNMAAGVCNARISEGEVARTAYMAAETFSALIKTSIANM